MTFQLVYYFGFWRRKKLTTLLDDNVPAQPVAT